MKKAPIIIFSMCLLFLCSCKSKNAEIETTAWQYLDAMGNYRIDDAAPFATRYTRENTLPIAKDLTEKTDSNYIRSNTPAEITIRGSKKLTDTSAFVYYHKHTPITEQEDSLLMLLEEGSWLADVRIEVPPFFDNSKILKRIKGDSVLTNDGYRSIKDLGEGKAVPYQKKSN